MCDVLLFDQIFKQERGQKRTIEKSILELNLQYNNTNIIQTVQIPPYNPKISVCQLSLLQSTIPFNTIFLSK